MSKLNSLKFLLLQKLNEHKSLINEEIHKEIAYSLEVKMRNDLYIINWKANNIINEISSPQSNFNFYKKSEYNETPDTNQITNNNSEGTKLILEIISKN